MYNPCAHGFSSPFSVTLQLMTSMMAHKREVIKARNLYLLTLKGSNVHTQRYFSKSLFELFEVRQLWAIDIVRWEVFARIVDVCS